MAESAAMYRSTLAAARGAAFVVGLFSWADSADAADAASGSPGAAAVQAADKVDKADKADKKEKPTPRACPKDKVWNESRGGCVCAPPSVWDGTTRKCVVDGVVISPRSQVASPKARAPSASGSSAPFVRPVCSAAQEWSEAHQRCIVSCPADQIADAKGATCLTIPKHCAMGSQWSDAHDACVPICPPGKILDEGARCVERLGSGSECAPGTERLQRDGACVATCPPGTRRVGKGKVCVSEPKECPEGREWKDAWNACVPSCPSGQVLDFKGLACHPIRRSR